MGGNSSIHLPPSSLLEVKLAYSLLCYISGRSNPPTTVKRSCKTSPQLWTKVMQLQVAKKTHTYPIPQSVTNCQFKFWSLKTLITQNTPYANNQINQYSILILKTLVCMIYSSSTSYCDEPKQQHSYKYHFSTNMCGVWSAYSYHQMGKGWNGTS